GEGKPCLSSLHAHPAERACRAAGRQDERELNPGPGLRALAGPPPADARAPALAKPRRLANCGQALPDRCEKPHARQGPAASRRPVIPAGLFDLTAAYRMRQMLAPSPGEPSRVRDASPPELPCAAACAGASHVRSRNAQAILLARYP